MESAELPLPTNPAVAKLLPHKRANGSAVESGIRVLSVPELSKVGVPESLYRSGSGSAVKAEIRCKENNSPFLNSNGKTCGVPLFQSAEKILVSKLHGKTAKEIKSKSGRRTKNGGLSRKRTRTNPEEALLNSVDGPDSTNVPMKKTDLKDPSCPIPFNGKSRKLNGKHSQASKTGKKRSCKSDRMTGAGSFGRKTGPINPNAGGKNILGIYGLKSNSIDVSKHMANLTLTDLLNGYCEVARFSRTDTRESNINNENIIQTVKNICKILPSQSVISKKKVNDLDNTYSLNGQLSGWPISQNKVNEMNFGAKIEDTTDQGKVVGQESSRRKEVWSSEPCEADSEGLVKATTNSVFPVHNLPFYQPEEFSKCLGIPSVETVDTLIAQCPFQMAAGLQSSSLRHSNTYTVQSGTIPPFHWSLPHVGPYKGYLDTGRLSMNRNTMQSRWIRVGATEFKNKYCSNESRSVPLETDQNVKLESGQIALLHGSGKRLEGCLDAPMGIDFVGQDNSCPAAGLVASQPVDENETKLFKETSLINFCELSKVKDFESNKLSVHSFDKITDERFHYPGEQCKGDANCVEATLKSKENVICASHYRRDCTVGVTDPLIQVPEKLRILNQEADAKNGIGSVFSLTGSSSKFRQSYITNSFHIQDNTPVPVSPRVLAAAQTLYDMAKVSQYFTTDRQQAFESWSGVSLKKVAKVQQSRDSIDADAEFTNPRVMEKKNSKSRAGGSSVAQKKSSSLERRKSLSQVNDTSRRVKNTVSTSRTQCEIMKVSKNIGGRGVSYDTTGPIAGKIFHDQAKDNMGDLGKGLDLLMTTSQKTSSKNVSKETHALAARRIIPLLSVQKNAKVGRFKFSHGHFTHRTNGEVSAKPDQSLNCTGSTHPMASSSRIQ